MLMIFYYVDVLLAIEEENHLNNQSISVHRRKHIINKWSLHGERFINYVDFLADYVNVLWIMSNVSK